MLKLTRRVSRRSLSRRSQRLFSQYKVPSESHFHSSLSHKVLRSWHGASPIPTSRLMYPIFVTNGHTEAIPSLPGQSRWSVEHLPELLDPLVEKGLQSVLLFGVLSEGEAKDDVGSYAAHADAPVPRALRLLSQRYPGLMLGVDVCLCAYTSHGHCGVLDHNHSGLDNTASVERMADIALGYAAHGAHMVAPSDMMDGRIGAIKHSLVQHGFGGSVSIMSYAAKFASCFYGPFRDAAGSGCAFGDRSGYQLAPGGRKLALRAAARDEEEGADVIMVKPGGPYLDIVRDVADQVTVPVAVYQVSGEYAMLYHGAKAGAFGLEEAVQESLEAMQRAGASVYISYFTPQLLMGTLDKQI